MRTRVVLFLASLALASGLCPGQYPLGAVGFYVSTNLGHAAGSPCWWFNCAPATTNVAAGEIVTLKITGEWHAPYLLATSTTAASCVAYAGILHDLVLDLPASIVVSGTLGSVSPILSCPNGYDTLTATVPAGLPPGTTIAVQALTYGAGNVLAFTGAILLTVT